MKKILLLIAVIFVLSGCSKTYDKEMEMGEKSLKEKNYEQAILHFEKASKAKENDKKAKAKLKDAKEKRIKAQEKSIIDYYESLKKNDSKKAYSLLNKKTKEKLVKEDFYNYQSIVNATSKVIEYKIEKTKKDGTFKVKITSKKQTNEKEDVFEVLFKITKENKEYKIEHEQLVKNFNDSFSNVYVDYGILYTTKFGENYEVANELYKKALDIKENNVWARHYYAYSFVQLKEYGKSEKEYIKTIKYAEKQKLDNEYISSLYGELAGVQFYLKNEKDAKENAEKALKLNEKNNYAKTILEQIKKA